MEDSDDYEATRQETIRQNKELLASLGLNSSTIRIGSPPPEPKPRKPSGRKRQQSQSSSPGPSTQPLVPTRERSARVAARGSRRVYNEKDLSSSYLKIKREPPAPREGSRKSGRLASGSRRRYGDDSDDEKGRRDSRYYEPDTSDPDSDDYVGGSRPRPAPPVKINTKPAPRQLVPNVKDSARPPRMYRPRGEDESDEELDAEGRAIRQPLPRRAKDGSNELVFEPHWDHFRPNLTPEQVLRGGAFGGTYFKEHYSRVLRCDLDVQAELNGMPAHWLRGMDLGRFVYSENYDIEVNRYRKKAGQSLDAWEEAGWIAKRDPRGWFQWYIHFYLGRRSTDDARQVSRWQKAVGQTGRFRRAADKSVASRQICWQWAVDAGYEAPEPQAPLVGPDGGDRLRTQDSGDEEGGGANSEDDEP